MTPTKYEINVAKANGLNWKGDPMYKWYCLINAGSSQDHANAVAEQIRNAFPAPEYHVSLHQEYAYTKPVDKFDWSVE